MAKIKTTPASADAYYAAMLSRKQSAGLSLADATEVTARQRAEDDANPEFTIPEP